MFVWLFFLFFFSYYPLVTRAAFLSPKFLQFLPIFTYTRLFSSLFLYSLNGRVVGYLMSDVPPFPYPRFSAV